jgi:uncharacterized protein YycO
MGMPFGIRGIMLVLLAIAAAKPRPVDVEPRLKTGDIVLQTSTSKMSKPIREATHSPYSHVGLVEVSPDGVFVIEAINPVSRTPFAQWRKRGEAGKITVERLKSLSPETASRVLDVAKGWLGRPYDVRFSKGDGALYCSELVTRAFEEGAQVTVGARQKLSTLDLSPADLARAKALHVSIDQEVITPASLAADEKLEQVASDF